MASAKLEKAESLLNLEIEPGDDFAVGQFIKRGMI